VTRRCDNDITDTNFDRVQAISQCELNVTLTGKCSVPAADVCIVVINDFDRARCTGAYSAAARVLRSTREEAGLTADSAAEAMETFQEEVSDEYVAAGCISCCCWNIRTSVAAANALCFFLSL
jgi:hypothetical protein